MSTSGQIRRHHKIVIVGAGAPASRWQCACAGPVKPTSPSSTRATTHYYQPLWTLVGGGCSTIAKSARLQADVMPKGVQWVQQSAASIDPDSRSVEVLLHRCADALDGQPARDSGVAE